MSNEEKIAIVKEYCKANYQKEPAEVEILDTDGRLIFARVKWTKISKWVTLDGIPDGK